MKKEFADGKFRCGARKFRKSEQIIPTMDGDEAQGLHKAQPGYQAVADDAARFAQKHGQTLNQDASVLADLTEGLAEVKRLEPGEHAMKVFKPGRKKEKKEDGR